MQGGQQDVLEHAPGQRRKKTLPFTVAVNVTPEILGLLPGTCEPDHQALRLRSFQDLSLDMMLAGQRLVLPIALIAQLIYGHKP